MPTNRERALDAAVELLGTEGLRALTHVRVDERAGLPRGSASNSFRTRAALLEGVVDRMVARELPAVASGFAPRTPDELVDSLAELFDHLTGEGAVMTAARLTLYMEAAHDEPLRAALARGRATMEDTIVPALESLGAADPRLVAQALAVSFEGMFVHRIARHADVDARGVLGLIVRAGVGGFR